MRRFRLMVLVVVVVLAILVVLAGCSVFHPSPALLQQTESSRHSSRSDRDALGLTHRIAMIDSTVFTRRWSDWVLSDSNFYQLRMEIDSVVVAAPAPGSDNGWAVYGAKIRLDAQHTRMYSRQDSLQHGKQTTAHTERTSLVTLHESSDSTVERAMSLKERIFIRRRPRFGIWVLLGIASVALIGYGWWTLKRPGE